MAVISAGGFAGARGQANVLIEQCGVGWWMIGGEEVDYLQRSGRNPLRASDPPNQPR